MRLGRLVLIAAAGALGIVAASSTAVAQDEGTVGIKLLEAPADRADDPRAQVAIVDHLEPGSRIERRVEVQNTTGETVTVDLYPAAATIQDGTWKPLDGRAENALTEWTTITPAQVDVESGGAEQATLTVEVPTDAPGGEHYAVAWAQPPSATDQGLTVVNRVGIRMYVSVGSDEPATDFAIADVAATTAADGTRSLDIDVDNVGGRAVDVRADAELTEGPGRITAGPYSAPSAATISPGGSGTVAVPVPAEIPAGPWTASVELRSGTTVRTATLTVTWPEPGAEPAGAEIEELGADDAGDTDGGNDAGTIAFAVLALLAVAILLWRFARREASPD